MTCLSIKIWYNLDITYIFLECLYQGFFIDKIMVYLKTNQAGTDAWH